MSTDIDHIQHISKYLQVSFGKLSFNRDKNVVYLQQNETVTGFTNILNYLIKEAKINIKPKNIEDDACIRQWLEYAVIYVKHCSDVTVAKQVLLELNSALATQTYFVSNYLTLADLVLYYMLYNIMVNLSPQDKVQYINVSRWFDNIQQDKRIRQNNRLINFDTNYVLCNV